MVNESQQFTTINAGQIEVHMPWSTMGGLCFATYFCYLEVDNTCVPNSAFVFSCCWYHVSLKKCVQYEKLENTNE